MFRRIKYYFNRGIVDENMTKVSKSKVNGDLLYINTQFLITL